MRIVEITTRQMDTIDLLNGGFSNRQIAQRLQISRRTVESHLSAVYGLTATKSRLELVVWLRENQLVISDQRTRTAFKLQMASRLLQQGITSLTLIARELGCSRQAAYRQVQKASLQLTAND